MAIFGTWMLSLLDAVEWFYRQSRPLEHYGFDEIVVFLSFFLICGLLWISVRRGNEVGLELAERRRMEALLNQLNTELEDRVEQRTAQYEMELAERRQTEAKLIRYQNRLRSLSLELSLTEEREKRRLADDLHDNLGHALALARNKLAMIEEELGPTRTGELEEVKDLVDCLIDHTRSLIFEMRPPTLDHLPFRSSVAWLAENVLEKNGITCQLEGEKNLPRLGEDPQLILFKVVRELLVNVVKHARAQTVRITLGCVEGALTVEIRDDGVGFVTSEDFISPMSQNGFGLFTSRERLMSLQGDFSLLSEPGRGTVATLKVPLDKKEQG